MFKFGVKGGSVLAYGELLWDLLPSGPVLGGAAANFALRLQELGIAVNLASALGEDELGRAAEKQMRGGGLDCALIQWKSKLPTGTVAVTLSAGGNPDFKINTGVAYDLIEVEPKLMQAASRCRIFYYGTLIQRAPVSRETLAALLEAAPQATKLVDINLRKNCFTRDSLRVSLERADIVKLSEHEVSDVCEILELPSSGLLGVPQLLIERFQLEACLVTLGEHGLYAGNQKGARLYCPGYQTEVRDLIGAGDACTAGFCAGMLSGLSFKECCRLGNMLGALSTTKAGGLSPISAEELSAFQDGPPPRLGLDIFARADSGIFQID